MNCKNSGLKEQIVILVVILSLFLLPSVLADSCYNAATDPVPLCNCYDVNRTREDLTANYQLQNNVNCRNTTSWNSGSGFEPIGSSSSQFSGSFDGQGFNISNLVIDRPGTNYIGLIGYVSTTGSVLNVGVLNASVTGLDYVGAVAGYNRGIINKSIGDVFNATSIDDYVGALVGGNQNIINNSRSSGTVSSRSWQAGGLVGYNNGGVVDNSGSLSFVSGSLRIGGLVGESSGGTVSNSYATGRVIGTSNQIGGLVGIIYSGAVVTHSYATGYVSTPGSSVGGLVGSSSGSISNSYALGNVTGSVGAGGIVGSHGTGTISDVFAKGNITGGSSQLGGIIGTLNSGTLTRAYATGTVPTGGDMGGVIGRQSGGSCTDSFWDTELSGKSISACGTGKTTSEMKDIATFTDTSTSGLSNAWDFAGTENNDAGSNDYWHITGATNAGYPYLLNVGIGVGVDVIGPVVTINSPSAQGYTSSTIIVNITLDENASALYSIDGGVTNHTLLNAIGGRYGLQLNDSLLSVADGEYTLRIYANDTLGNTNFAQSVNFSVETNQVAPSTPLLVSPSPADGVSTASTSFNFNWTVTDNVDTTLDCNLTIDGVVNVSNIIVANGTGRNQTVSGFVGGTHTWNVSCEDHIGLVNVSATRSFTIDSQAPLLNIVSPSDGLNTTDTGLDVNYTAFDANLDSCWYANDTMSVNTTLAGCSNITSVTWSEGQHNVTIWANDSFSNINSSTISFTVDTQAPVFSNLANQSIVENISLLFDIDATDSTAVSCFSVNDTTRFSINCTGHLQNNTNLGIATYLLNVSVNDTFGFSRSEVMQVDVTRQSRVQLTLVSPTRNINITQNETFDVTVTVTCSNANCGDINVSLDPIPELPDNNIELNSKQGRTTSEEVLQTQSTITLYDVKSFSYEIQDGCSIIDGQSDVFDNGLRLYINSSNLFSGTRFTTEDSGREAVCAAQTIAGMNVSRKVYVPSTENWARYLEILHNPSASTVCASVRIWQNMGSDGADFINTSDYNNSWELTDHWLMWDDTSSTAGDDAAGFVYQQDGADETIDARIPATASGGYHEWTWENVCVPAGETKILMHFFTQMDTRAQSEAQADAIYTGNGNATYRTGLSAAESSQIVNWGATSSKGGLIPNTIGATPFYTTVQNPYSVTLNAGESRTITWTVNATGSMDNTYAFFVFANRTADFSVGDRTQDWNVTISNTSTELGPVVTIVNPSTNLFTADVGISINYSVSSSLLDSCWYTYDGLGSNVTVSSCSNITGITWSEAQQNITIYANDTNGIIGSASVSFTIDLTNPSLSIVYPLNYFNSSNAGLDVNYTINELNVDSCWYSNDTMSVNYTLVNCANITSRTWIEGQHNVTIWINDSVGNIAGDSVSFTTDLSNPRVSLVSPTQGNISTIIGEPQMLFNCSVTDNYALANVSLYLTNSSNSSFDINQTTFLNGNESVGEWRLNPTTGDYTWNCLAYDNVGRSSWGVNRTFQTTVFADIDNDGIQDTNDTLLFNETNIAKTGITRLNITIGNNRTNQTYRNKQQVKFYDGTTLLFNFSHNFSQQNLNLANITVIKASNYIIVNMSNQLQGNKSLYITDSNFVSLCVKDDKVSSISQMSGGCDGVNETDFTNCLGNNETINRSGLSCTDLGSQIRINNLQHSAIRGTVPVSIPSSSGGSSGGGSSRGGFTSIFSPGECSFNAECKFDEVCHNRQCVKLFDVKLTEIKDINRDRGEIEFTYFLKGMAQINDDVIIDFTLVQGNKTFSSGRDTIYIGSYEEKTEVARLQLPKNISEGKYELYVTLTYKKYKAESHRSVFFEKDEKGKIEVSFDDNTEKSPESIALIICLVLSMVMYAERKRIMAELEHLKHSDVIGRTVKYWNKYWLLERPERKKRRKENKKEEKRLTQMWVEKKEEIIQGKEDSSLNDQDLYQSQQPRKEK